ncbi:M48 family metalloprotease [Paenibacillus sp. RRE4]|uniref:M48 family metalloprotease n=1 Tax=Paenibacillus sp. RRE4 TaxID=2962587 RepID=UPI002882C66F|nr:M48 family metalloprotease [Paenibacillus sp. RRE4]MDT0123955.1 M48 family metalloprotease [Paenibacillus sp. RRE4]
MGLLYSISFLAGNFLGISHMVHLLMGINDRKNRDKKIEWFAIVLLIWLQVSPAVVLFFLFQSQYNWIQHALIIIVSFSVGFKWTGSWIQTTNELEKVILGEKEIKSTEKTSVEQFERNYLVRMVKYLQNIYERMFPYKAWLKRYIHFLPGEQDDRAVQILQELSQEIGVLNVILCVYPSDNTGGYAILKPRFRKGVSFVLISSFASENLSYDELRALIAHELMHIRNKDYRSNDILFSLGTIYVSLFATILYASLIDLISNLFPFLAIVLLIVLPLLLIVSLIILLYFLHSKQGYWFQIGELRADRKSCMLSGDMREGMLNLLERLKYEEETENSNKIWFQRYFSKYNSWHSHPSVDYRIKMIQNYKQWSYRDYFIHFLQTIKWAITGKGWSGS